MADVTTDATIEALEEDMKNIEAERLEHVQSANQHAANANGCEGTLSYLKKKIEKLKASKV